VIDEMMNPRPLRLNPTGISCGHTTIDAVHLCVSSPGRPGQPMPENNSSLRIICHTLIHLGIGPVKSDPMNIVFNTHNGL
jgi:hypothetical protein